ncbi:hypothetical protein [Culicoidibacter larvae]|uniref:Uncharacterized protein n=1 Tax=Culicoidibacter larvae TaxID=2579976 RepID=A0A5R8Q6I9_9FIRM|nr:hypothetical protein [Culicoidibacter larvae]TLG70269.1 hypothetical protein FEZ08_12025 [Culicoidibacter larvae]
MKKYYLFKEPYYALIIAINQLEAIALYEKYVCEITDNELDVREISESDAIDEVERSAEKCRKMGLDESYVNFPKFDPNVELLLIDGDLL